MKPLSRSNRAALAALLLAAAGTVAMAQDQRGPLASGWIMGATVWPRGKPVKQSYRVQLNLVGPQLASVPGATVAFGALDTGQVVWMAQTERQPSMAVAGARRDFATPTPPLTAQQVPRYVMVCAWPLTDDGRAAGPVVTGYAERDDSRTSIDRDGTLQENMTLHWVSVPAERVRKRFAAFDHCGAAAQGRADPAPHWLNDR
jgi:hypothetical protein